MAAPLSPSIAAMLSASDVERARPGAPTLLARPGIAIQTRRDTGGRGAMSSEALRQGNPVMAGSGTVRETDASGSATQDTRTSASDLGSTHATYPWVGGPPSPGTGRESPGTLSFGRHARGAA